MIWDFKKVPENIILFFKELNKTSNYLWVAKDENNDVYAYKYYPTKRDTDPCSHKNRKISSTSNSVFWMGSKGDEIGLEDEYEHIYDEYCESDWFDFLSWRDPYALHIPTFLTKLDQYEKGT